MEAYADQILGEQRREPYYWSDSRFNQRNQPVVGVNWYEALAYAAWLSRVTGKAYRLPTEAEWEWAARRNTRRYPWGNEWDPDRCNWRGSALNRPNPVGVYRQGATVDGLQELAGNVYEWTLSLYRPYPYEPDDGREEIDVEGLRVLRGGSWYIGQGHRAVCVSAPRRSQAQERRHGISPRQDLSLGCCLLSAVPCPLIWWRVVVGAQRVLRPAGPAEFFGRQ